MFDNLCLICIHCDASLEMLKKHIQRLYSPEVEKVYVRVSNKLNLFQRVRMLKAVRRVFTDTAIDIKTVTEWQIYLIAAFNAYVKKRR